MVDFPLLRSITPEGTCWYYTADLPAVIRISAFIHPNDEDKSTYLLGVKPGNRKSKFHGGTPSSLDGLFHGKSEDKMDVFFWVPI